MRDNEQMRQQSCGWSPARSVKAVDCHRTGAVSTLVDRTLTMLLLPLRHAALVIHSAALMIRLRRHQ